MYRCAPLPFAYPPLVVIAHVTYARPAVAARRAPGQVEAVAQDRAQESSAGCTDGLFQPKHLAAVLQARPGAMLPATATTRTPHSQRLTTCGIGVVRALSLSGAYPYSDGGVPVPREPAVPACRATRRLPVPRLLTPVRSDAGDAPVSCTIPAAELTRDPS